MTSNVTIREQGFFNFAIIALIVLAYMSVSSPAFAIIEPTSANCSSTDPNCNICVSQTFNLPNAGQYMIGQMFQIINTIIGTIENGFYNGIVTNPRFQQILGVGFLLYIVIYGVMIMFGLASHRGGEVTIRLVKLAIVYAMTTAGGWVFFSTWIQNPVVGEMNELITAIANAGGSGSGGTCISGGSSSLGGSDTSIYLSSGAVAMLFGPMSCVFAAKFVAGLAALITMGIYGWILGGFIFWGMIEFVFMLLGALATYVKSIVGLAFLFALGPIFFAFYLFEKTRALTEAWFGMIIGFALQPVLLFLFLAFYANIVGTAIGNLFSTGSGSSQDICYVPWVTLSGLMTTYKWSFTNSSGAAGGQWINYGGSSTANASSLNSIGVPPVQVINILYFVVLCNLGKNFANYIGDISTRIAGGRGAGVTSGDAVKQKVMGIFGKGVRSLFG